MSEIEKLEQKVNDLSSEFKEHRGELSSVLNTLVESNNRMSSGFEKLTVLMTKSEAIEKQGEDNSETIKEISEKVHVLDKKADLAELSEKNIIKTAEDIKKDSKERSNEIKSAFKAALMWFAGIFSGVVLIFVTVILKFAVTKGP